MYSTLSVSLCDGRYQEHIKDVLVTVLTIYIYTTILQETRLQSWPRSSKTVVVWKSGIE